MLRPCLALPSGVIMEGDVDHTCSSDLPCEDDADESAVAEASTNSKMARTLNRMKVIAITLQCAILICRGQEITCCDLETQASRHQMPLRAGSKSCGATAI